MSEQEIVLEIKNVKKAFHNHHVLNGFNLKLHRSENIVVLGKSGSGKSVLIKCVIGLIQPDSGSIRVFNEEITGISTSKLDNVRSKVGFLFQSNALYDSMTVRENLEFPLRRKIKKLASDNIDELVTKALEDVGLKDTIDMMPNELSGGMRKRIAIARTLIMKPEIILYDEPTTGLDPITGLGIIDLMNEIKNKYQTASLIISHDMNCVKKAGDLIAVLTEGICYALGTYEELKKNKHTLIKQFFE